MTSKILNEVDIKKYYETDFYQREIIKSFNTNIFDELTDLFYTSEIATLSKIADEFKKRKLALSSSLFNREIQRFIIEFSWKSSQIEGNTYDIIEVESLLTDNIRAQGKTEEEAIMIVNHKKAVELILANYESFKKLGYSDVLQLHNTLTSGLVTSGIRKHPVQISGTMYIPLTDSVEIENNLKKIIEKINDTKFPIAKALIASSMIAYLQPFTDGNKRTSRTLANAILLAFDYFPLSYRNVDVNEYRKALLLFYEQNNLFHLKKMFVDQLLWSQENYFRI